MASYPTNNGEMSNANVGSDGDSHNSTPTAPEALVGFQVAPQICDDMIAEWQREFNTAVHSNANVDGDEHSHSSTPTASEAHFGTPVAPQVYDEMIAQWQREFDTAVTIRQLRARIPEHLRRIDAIQQEIAEELQRRAETAARTDIILHELLFATLMLLPFFLALYWH
ncbi:hypothetical protein V8F20_008309 [Naviculisporaceae sp. PSN 640]